MRIDDRRAGVGEIEHAMSVNPRDCSDGMPPVMAVRAREAARILGISERKLWELTNQRLIPHVRLTKAILYPIDQLREWLAEESKRAMEW